MDGISGFKTAAAEELPAAVALTDPFHVARLAAQAPDACRRRVRWQLHGHRGRAGDPPYTATRTLSTGDDLLTEKQRARLAVLVAEPKYVKVEATWGIYQRMVSTYRDHDRARGWTAMTALIDAVATGVPTELIELRRLGRTLKQRRGDVIAYYDRPHTSNAPTEAIQGAPRAPARIRPRLPQPRHLHREEPA